MLHDTREGLICRIEAFLTYQFPVCHITQTSTHNSLSSSFFPPPPPLLSFPPSPPLLSLPPSPPLPPLSLLLLFQPNLLSAHRHFQLKTDVTMGASFEETTKGAPVTFFLFNDSLEVVVVVVGVVIVVVVVVVVIVRRVGECVSC